MALTIADRVQQTGTANTTVSFTLTSTATGYQSFTVVGNGNTTYYSAFDASGNWEVGIGTYATGGTLTRTTILSSSNSGSAVTFSGSVTVFVTYPSEKSVNLDASGNATALGTVASATLTNATGLPLTTGVTGTLPTANGGTNLTSFTSNGAVYATSTSALATGTLPVISGGTGVTSSTGTGNTVLSNTPTLVTPVIGAATGTSLQVTNGIYSTGVYGGSYTDGIVVDYSSGNGRISVGSVDSLTFYNGGIANTALVTFNSSGAFGVGASQVYGTTGQVLTSNGSSSAPSWATPSGTSKAAAIAYALTFGL